MLGRDSIAGLVGLGGSLWFLALTRGLPHPALVPIGPGFYPRIVLTITAVLSAALIVSDLARRRAAPPPRTARYRLVVVAFLVFAAYVAVLPLLGYRLATFLFVWGLQVLLDVPGPRRWLLALGVAAGTALVTHLVFEGYLSVLLPRGRLTGF